MHFDVAPVYGGHSIRRRSSSILCHNSSLRKLNMSGQLTANKDPKRVFHTMDWLRGLAAIAVVGRHLGGEYLNLLPSSGLAVDLFFGLSGFVIAHAYERRIDSGLSSFGFMRLRIIRLYPIYILGSVISIASFILMALVGQHVLHPRSFFANVVFAFLFLPVPQGYSADGAHPYPFNFPAWSLCWELAINALYAVIVPWLRTSVLVGLVVIGALLLAAGAWTFGSLEGGSLDSNFGVGGLRVVYSFFAGAAMFRVWSAGKLKWCRLSPWICAFILLLVFACRPSNEALYDFL